MDISAEGGAGDAGTWAWCSLHRAIRDEQIGFPEPTPLPNGNREIPFHLIGDDAFALKTWLMKLYAHLSQIHNERVFSYRLSHARRVVENAFGILHQRWRIFSTTLLVRPRVVCLTTICACLLHNLQLQRQPP
ncbi:uncharacterized protein LOC123513957 [Portunus trituberculatus]|uniref:uncharacterized protein LOC123513957 n=1 Tax=Portunus trituberculatus TaxID=210409 RepID=UPI001E1CFF48|nr:uncharacterized protein LOC123513957 [Portunus trituberculatus]